jgi:8-oxo-dGTP diphosphatase
VAHLDGGQVVSRDPIVAAGCLVTRQGPRGLEVLLVHRPRYDDWSLPKGKVDAGEHITCTAVREVLEETGCHVALRRPLPERRYLVDGERKVVHYWRAEVLAEGTFTPHDEVDEIRWLSVDDAAALVTHVDDASLVKLASEPAGTPFVLLRHGHAVKRSDWTGQDVDRPLDAAGVEQAEVLVRALAAYGVTRLHSSAARRCSDTVRPYSLTAGVPLAAEPSLTEEGFEEAPDAALQRAVELLVDAAKSEEPTALCGHRPYLPALVDLLVSRCPASPTADPWDLPLPDTVPTASLIVLHVHHDASAPSAGERMQALALELHTR